MSTKSVVEKIIKKISSKNHNNIWVFGEWFGERCCDNSLYLANYVIEKDKNLKIYWIAKKECDTSLLNKNIEVIAYGSLESKSLIEKADVVIVNQGILDIVNDKNYVPRKSFYVNLWHGVPWKKILFDVPKRNKTKLFLKKQFYKFFNCVDLIPSTSGEYSRIINTAFCLFGNSILNSGYPRNDIFYSQNEIQNCKKKLHHLFPFIDKKYIITYMPTFRDSKSKVFSFLDILNDKTIKFLSDNKIVILQKAHYVDSKNNINIHNNEFVVNINNEITSQELLAGSDMLITDYSSCFFDFLLLDKPIIHYLYDFDYYMNEDRGLYYKKEDVYCGDCPSNVEDLIKAIKNNIENPNLYKNLREIRRNKFMEYESNNSCDIIYKEVIKRINKI